MYQASLSAGPNACACCAEQGIISAAMLIAIDRLGLKRCFDAIYGSSAGAINSTFFLTGQEYGLDIYTEDLIGRKFIDFARVLRGRPIMDLVSRTIKRSCYLEKLLTLSCSLCGHIPSTSRARVLPVMGVNQAPAEHGTSLHVS